MPKIKNHFLLNNYNYKLTICEFNQNSSLQKLLIIQSHFLAMFKNNLKIIIKSALSKLSKKFTILKAPFVHKKAREQFSLKTTSQALTFCFTFTIDKLLNSFMFNLLKSNLKTYNISYTNFSFSFEKVNKKTFNENMPI